MKRLLQEIQLRQDSDLAGAARREGRSSGVTAQFAIRGSIDPQTGLRGYIALSGAELRSREIGLPRTQPLGMGTAIISIGGGYSYGDRA